MLSQVTDDSLVNADVPILNKYLKQDTNLKLSNREPVVQEIIQTSIIGVNSKEDKVRELKKAISLPSTYVFAALSSRIYEFDKDGKDKSGKIVHGEMDKELVNWQLLTVAHSYDPLFRSYRNGYFGSAYWNSHMQQIIIVHSGTRNGGGVFADLKGVVLNRHTSQINSAITFTDKILDILRTINRTFQNTEGPYIQLFFTGHSLGGWLSQIASFFAKYMVRIDDNFSASKDFEQTGYHAMAVVFDSPGCRTMLQRIQDGIMDRSNPFLVSSLNITNYVGAPNLVNTCNAYIGDAYKVFLSLSEEEKKSWWNMNVKYTSLMHQIKRIKEVFNTKSGEVLADERGDLKILKILDWPLLFAETSSAIHVNKVVSFVQKLTGLLPKNWSPKFYQELKNFFKWANKSNDFHPSEKSITFKIGETEYRTVRYKTKSLNKDYINEQNVNVFTQSERLFLERYKFLMLYAVLQNDLLPEKFLPPLDNKSIDMLKDYEINTRIIRSNQLQKLIPCIKRMLYFFPEIKYKVENAYHNLPTNICIELYQRAASSYLSTVDDSLKFTDTLGLAHFLNGKDKTIFYTIQSSISIGFSRIYTIFNSLNSTYRDIKSHAFLNLDSIFYLEWRLLHQILNKLTDKQKYLLVIACDRVLDNKTKGFFDGLLKVLRVKPLLKIVLVTKTDSDMHEFFETCVNDNELSNSYEVKDNIQVSFTDLTIDSQEQLLEKKAIFQGNAVSINTILGYNNTDLHAINDILDSNAITQLIKNEEIKIGKALPTLGKTKSYYIDRRLIRNVKIDEKALNIFLKKYPDLLAISCNPEDKLLLENWETSINILEEESSLGNPKRCSVLSGKDDEVDFENLCMNNPAYNIHWIKKDGKDLFWLRSYGSIAEFRHCINISSNTISMENIDDFDGKFVIIAAEPGMGKSTLLTHLGVQGTTQESNSKWFVRVNLVERKVALNHTIDFDNVDNIVSFLHATESTISCKLTRKLMKLRFYNNGDIVLLFDGFDEINSRAQENFIKLLESLETMQIERVFISTRLHLRNRLEDTLSTFAYTFQPFSKENQRQFLKQFWRYYPLDNISEECLSDFIDRLLILISKSIRDKEKNFMGIPLQMRMIAEAFQDELVGGLVLPEDFDMLKLYDRFIRTKYQIYLKKMGINIDLDDEGEGNFFITKISKVHANLAFTLLFSEIKSNFLKGKLPSEVEKETMTLIGIVQFINEEIIFVHRTFAEYFVAKFLVDKLNRENNRVKYGETLEFLSREFFRNENEVIICFLNYSLSKEKVLVDAFKGNLNNIRVAIASGAISCTDVLGRNALHYAAQKGHIDVVKLLLENNSHLNVTDRLGKMPLHYAARYNFIDSFYLVELLMNVNVKLINARDNNGCTAVFYVKENHDYNTMLCLIANDADVSQIGRGLHHLCDFYRDAFIFAKHAKYNGRFTRNLLKRIPKNTQENDGNTIAHVAVEMRDNEIVDFLLKKGASVNIRNNEGKLPIHYAALYENWRIVESLLRKYPCYYELSETQKVSLLSYSIASSHWDIVTLFMSEDNTDILNQLSEEQEEELLKFCISSRNFNLVDYLSEKDTEWSDFNKKCNKPIISSTSGTDWGIANFFLYFQKNRQHRSIVEFFLEKGADLNNLNTKQKLLLLNYSLKNDHRNIADRFMGVEDKNFYFDCLRDDQYLPYLFQQISEGTLEAVRFFTESLISKEIINNVDVSDQAGETLLHIAARYGHLEIAQYLVDEKGAELDAVNDFGSTPLHLAIENDKLNVVRYLISKGAYTRILNNESKTCEDMINDRDYSDIITFLKAVQDAQRKLFQLVEIGENDFQKVGDLISQGANVNARNSDGDTLLFLATRNNNLQTVEFLIQNGADLTMVTRHNQTAKGLAEENNYSSILNFLKEAEEENLFHAIKNHNINHFDKLINQGVNINATRSVDDLTYLHFAAKKGDLFMVKRLIKKGANVDAKDRCRNTPKDYAIQNGYSDVADYLDTHTWNCFLFLRFTCE